MTTTGRQSPTYRKVVVVCIEGRDGGICEARVGGIKRMKGGMLFKPAEGPIFYLEPWTTARATNEVRPRAWCDECDKWLVVDESMLLEALDKSGTPTVRAWALP